MDYESLAMNLPAASTAAEIEAEPVNTAPLDTNKTKDKTRRYWTPHEEEHFYEIWGRDNWRLTRNGKNTIFFGQWSEELRERYDIDVKPEEIQAKVNQTRAKFRQVKKTLQNDTTGNVTRWKKFDIIDRILKNLYRPKDAEPLPPEALINNRDMSPPRTTTPTEHATDQGLNLSTTAEAVPNNFYNSNSNNSSGGHNIAQNNSTGYSTELFTDQYDDVKQEYDEDYPALPFQDPMPQYSPAEPAQLLELQTPHQQQQQQQQHQQQQQQQHQQHQQQQQSQQQQQQHQFQTTYEQGVVAYAPAAPQPQPTVHYTTSNTNSVAGTIHQPITAVAYINSSNNTISVATSSNGMQLQAPPPTAVAVPVVNNVGSSVSTPTPTPRKRGRPFGSATAPSADSLEAIFIEEVRRKNNILAEQTEIQRQRLQLEERKVALMATFFPKCLEQQALILTRFAPRVHEFQQQQPQDEQ